MSGGRERRARAACSAALGLALLLAGCGAEASGDGESTGAPAPLNVVLIVVDTLRADHLEAYGYDRATSPALRGFAERSVVFTRAYSHAPWTKPSVATLMTSLEPRDHGLAGWDDRLSRDLLTLPQHLKAQGYRTEAIVSHHALQPEFSRFHRGFDRYDISAYEQRGVSHDISSATEVSDAALEALARLESPFFLWLHYFDPHDLYLAHAEHDFGGEDVDRYDGEIAHTDRQIGRVLDALREAGRLDDTVVVLTADHGEEFGDHGGRFHGQTLFDEVLRVPLIVHAPGLNPARLDRSVGLVDVAPTLLELAGLPVPDAFAGRPVPRRGDALLLADHRPVFAETHHHADAVGVVMGPWKLLRDRRQKAGWMLFDTEADPGEQRNLFLDRADVAARLRGALKAYQARAGGAADVEARSEEFERLLEQLGYTR